MSIPTLSEEYIKEIIVQIAFNLKLKKWSYDVQKFESIGQNYFGVLIPITLSAEGNGSSRNYQVVLKLAPTDERFRVSGAVTIMFNREVFVYSKLLKKYQELQAVTSLRYCIPTLYFARDEYCKEVIAMRDMREEGFKPYSHQVFLDLVHATVALQSLAQLHALSFILKKQDCKLYDEVSKICMPTTEASNKRFMEILIDRLEKALNKFNETQYQHLLENLKLNCVNLFDEAIAMARRTCICHGDIWKENILFKYEGVKPVQACIIDYQTMRISSPAFDTLYLIISSTDSELRSKYYHHLLDTYYKSFQQSLQAFELDCDVIYSKEMFEKDLKLVAPACFITANTAYWLSNGLQEEGHVRSKHVWKTPEEKTAAVETYKSIVKGIIDDLCSYGYFSEDIGIKKLVSQ